MFGPKGPVRTKFFNVTAENVLAANEPRRTVGPVKAAVEVVLGRKAAPGRLRKFEIRPASAIIRLATLLKMHDDDLSTELSSSPTARRQVKKVSELVH